MKKILFLFAFIATLIIGSMSTVSAQVNYTVYDGSQTSSQVPVYGLYCDSYLKCEYVIPADHLTAISGSNISSLTYYLSSSPSTAWTCNFQVFLKEVESAAINSFSGMSDATIVYEGTLDASSGTMVVNFATPYQYNGGNLLIGFYNTNTGNYSGSYFYGSTITNSSVQGYSSSSLSSISANQRNFIPKTTFTVDELHGCITPTQLAVSDITANGATASWTPGNQETNWVVKFNELEFSTTTPSYTATTLNPSTTYVVSVKAVCSATEESEYTTPGVSFTTLCTSTVVTETEPFTEDFNTLTSGIPNCWDNAEGTVSYDSYKWNYYATGVTGACVRFNSYSPSSGQYSLLKTPVLDLTAISNPMLTFTHKNPSAAQGFDVMYTTDGGTTYTTIATGLVGETSWTTEEIVVPELANANNVMFVFKGISNCGYGDDYIYLDDVMVSQAPTCPKPTGVTVSSVTTNSANIAWTNGGDETAWTISYNGTEISATTNPFTLTGLTDATDYTVMVRANCSATDSSDWSAALTFTTPCIANTTFPYAEDFESTTFPPTCWSQTRLAGTSSSTNYPNGAWARSTSTMGSNVTAQAKLQDDRAGNLHQLITGSHDFTYAGGYMLSIDVYRSASGSYYQNEGIRIYVNNEPTVNANATELAFISRNYTVASTVNPEIVGAETASGWYTYELPITATGVNYIIFQGESQYGSSTYMDNVVIDEVPTCPKPTGVTVSNVTTNSADIAWTNGGDETAWTISYNGTEISATTNPFTLTGLTDATDYTVMVRANCSATDSSDWSASAAFTTLCEIFVVTNSNPFTEDFNTLTSGIPTCWDNAEGTTATESFKWNYYAIGTTGACVKFNSYTNTNNNTNYLKTPELDLSGLTDVMVSFSYKNPTGGDFSVFYTTDGTNYVEIATGLTGVSDWTNVEYTVDDLAGATNARIIFKGTSNYGSNDANIYLDDILVSKVPTCLKPTEVVILDSLTTDNSAVVDWTPAGDETQWEVACNGDTTLVSAHPFTITGLNPSTSYSVFVRAYCSADDQSYWAPAVNFITECASVVTVTFDNPYHEGFEGNFCWSIQQIAGYDNWSLTTYDVFEGDYAAYFPYDEGAEGLLISPVFDLTQIVNPEISFQYKTKNWSGTCDELELYYRTAETEEWVLIDTFNTPMEDYDMATYALPAPTATYQIAFKGIGMDAYNVYLDDIDITGEEPEIPCETPTNVTVDGNTVTWESDAESFILAYSIEGDSSLFVTIANANTYTFTGLEDSTVVSVAIQAVCDSNSVSEFTDEVTFTYIDTTTGIANYGNIIAKVYPNPATDVINIECNEINANLAIFDMFGKQVMNTQIQNAMTELNIRALAPGVYMIRIANNNEFTTVKVVKK